MTYAYDTEADFEDYDDDDDSDYGADDVLAVRLAQLERENSELRRRLGTGPTPKPVTNFEAEVASARSPEEVMAVVQQHNAAAATPTPPPEPADSPELRAAIAAAKSPEEVMQLVHEAGFSSSLLAVEDRL